jgi:hypothetical protein
MSKVDGKKQASSAKNPVLQQKSAAEFFAEVCHTHIADQWRVIASAAALLGAEQALRGLR